MHNACYLTSRDTRILSNKTANLICMATSFKNIAYRRKYTDFHTSDPIVSPPAYVINYLPEFALILLPILRSIDKWMS